MFEKKDYIEFLRNFELIHDFSRDVSNEIGGREAPAHLLQAAQLFVRMTITGMSIIHLSPENRIYPAEKPVWDMFSIASLTRNFMENYHMLYYIAVENVNEDERELRYYLSIYHLNNERYKMYKEFKNWKYIDEFEKNLPRAKEHLKQLPYFRKLSKSLQGKMLEGRSAMYLSHKEITERLPFMTDEFAGYYRLLSNHTHSTPFSYITMTNDRGRGNEGAAEINYFCLFLQLCDKYLSAAIIDMLRLFPDSVPQLNELQINVVKKRFEAHQKKN